MSGFQPRPAQEKILRYRTGRMGVSAVPGSGKTWTLSRLAADLIESGAVRDDQEILIVTLVNSAVDNFKSRIGSFIQAGGLLTQVGYRVRTLHGLANDIVNERPDLLGLSDSIAIVDENISDQILTDISQIWLRANGHRIEGFLDPNLEEGKRDWVRREYLPGYVKDIARAFIKLAKDSEETPESLQNRLEVMPVDLQLADMGCAIYRDYQRSLAYRGAVDFDDLVRLAAQALSLDVELRNRLQNRWPYILEDEAQDSSKLQENILRLLVGPDGNWVRVGDPNQAIFETFTTASPEFLRNFLAEPNVQARELPNSGRSTHSIIRLANELIRWTQSSHPVPPLRKALAPPYIQPTPPGDAQPNPPDHPEMIFLVDRPYTGDAELKAIADSLERWLPENPDKTVAVLVPTNSRGAKLGKGLAARAIDYVELLRTPLETRKTAGALGNVLNYLSDPKSASRLAKCYRVLRRDERDDPDAMAQIEEIVALLRKCRRPEQYLWPMPGEDWLEDISPQSDAVMDELERFAAVVRRWQQATVLPIDQLVLTLAQDLFTEPADLALTHKLAIVLKRTGGSNIAWRLPEMADELAVVAKNERRFLGFTPEESGFDPDAYKGRVVITTMHKAKGLEWDRVYMTSVNNYDFPSAEPYDQYMSEKWFIRDRLDLQAETLAELKQLFADDPYGWAELGEASQEARLEYAAERLRLLFVGITRAKEDLVITWNTGRKGDMQAALPFTALKTIWEEIQ